jgi:hypothetical protein
MEIIHGASFRFRAGKLFLWAFMGKMQGLPHKKNHFEAQNGQAKLGVAKPARRPV